MSFVNNEGGEDWELGDAIRISLDGDDGPDPTSIEIEPGKVVDAVYEDDIDDDDDDEPLEPRH